MDDLELILLGPRGQIDFLHSLHTINLPYNVLLHY